MGIFQYIASSDMRRVQLYALCAAVLIYGAFGSPTPDVIGWVEYVVAGLLVFAIGVRGSVQVFRVRAGDPAWMRVGQVFVLFGVSVPVLVGVMSGHGAGVMVRDVAAFLFMGLPVLLWPVVRGYERVLLYAVLALAVLFALREVFDVPWLAAGEELFYLANMPSVLMAAIVFMGWGVQRFVEDFSLRAVLQTAACAGLSLLCLWPILVTNQRASLALFVLSGVVILSIYIWRSPRRAIWVLAGVVAVAAVFWADVVAVMDRAFLKTQIVGANMRAAEWAGVWDEISAHLVSLIFGQGWGASFLSPAVADIRVNFTHGAASSFLLKTGLFGMVLMLVYVGVFLSMLARGFRAHPVLACALAGPILIDVTLYASFKSLDFGLVLALIPALYYSKSIKNQ